MVTSNSGVCALHHLGCECEDCVTKEQLARKCERLIDEILSNQQNGDKREMKRLSTLLKETKEKLSKY